MCTSSELLSVATAVYSDGTWYAFPLATSYNTTLAHRHKFSVAFLIFLCKSDYMRWLPTSVHRLSVCPVVISQKLSKTDPQFLWNSYYKVGNTDSVAAFRWPLGRYYGFKYKIRANINMASCSTCRQTTAVVNRARPSSASVVNCCKQSATLRTCCSQSLSTVLMMPKSNRRQDSFCLQRKLLLKSSISGKNDCMKSQLLRPNMLVGTDINQDDSRQLIPLLTSKQSLQ